jgi:thymidylate synthase ThyX
MTRAERRVYLLNPKELSPETIAVTFARTSRSPQSFDEIASELTDEKSAQFHEKWVVGYGHSSVAEHAVLHIAIENVSRLAIEAIESNRLASYTEKSTRYQRWDADSFYVPQELDENPLRELYVKTCGQLFETYAQALDAVRAAVERETPRKEGETETAWDRRIRSMYVDVCRFLLPAASLANVGLTANARLLEHAIRKLLSHPLSEARAIGVEIKRVAQQETPTLVKYAEPSTYLEESARALTSDAATISDPQTGSAEEWCRLLDYDPVGENKILAAALYRFGRMSFPQALAAVNAAGDAERRRWAASLLGSMGPYDEPLREMEQTQYAFDVVMDQGAYFEVKRHRMMTQTPQGLTASLGYAVPRMIQEAGFEEPYRRAMETAREAYERLVQADARIAAYIVPNGFNRRVLLTMNLRSAYHFCTLRSAPNAHFSVRRVARRVAEEIQCVHPLLAAWMRLPEGESWQSIQDRYFAQV